MCADVGLEMVSSKKGCIAHVASIGSFVRMREDMVFKMGRGHEADLRVSDISVSRCHAVIKWDEEKQNFFLRPPAGRHYDKLPLK